VIRVFWRERAPWVLARLRVKTGVAVPWKWTDLPVPQTGQGPSPNNESVVLLSPTALRDLVRFLHSRRERNDKNHFNQ
jgi:hypothetical protein